MDRDAGRAIERMNVGVSGAECQDWGAENVVWKSPPTVSAFGTPATQTGLFLFPPVWR